MAVATLKTACKGEDSGSDGSAEEDEDEDEESGYNSPEGDDTDVFPYK